MKYIKCDHCDKDYETGEGFFLEVGVPAGYPGVEQDAVLDICSPACLIELAVALDGNSVEPEYQPTLPEEEELAAKATDSHGHLVTAAAMQGAPYLGAFEGEVRVR